MSFLESLWSFNELFRHLLEQNQKREPSRLTNIIPKPAGKPVPQKEH